MLEMVIPNFEAPGAKFKFIVSADFHKLTS